MPEEDVAGRKCRIEYIDVETLLAQVRTKIQKTQWGIGLHDLKLFGVFGKKVSVSEQQVGHLRFPHGRSQAANWNKLRIFARACDFKLARGGVLISADWLQRNYPCPHVGRFVSGNAVGRRCVPAVHFGMERVA